MLMTYLCLNYASRLSKTLGPMGIDAITRIVGFFVSAIGVACRIFDGVIEALELHGMTNTALRRSLRRMSAIATSVGPTSVSTIRA